ncbi:lipoprotein [Streptomyces fructofermentans]|uniref:Lipoprotein n=1 Tax=Streptomyces fructofermentans TaxID=152141 RepID=A0A918N8Q6_9ACTN|nr:lipoprotein [Streptomyces fructofermentans]
MERQRRRRGPAVAAAAAGLMACATGCSGSGAAAEDPRGTEDAVAVLRQAPATLVRAGTSKARTSMEMATGGTRVTIRGEGVYDYEDQVGRLRVLLPQDPSGADEHRPITELLAPGALYMKNRGAGVPADKWVRVATATLSDGNLVTGGATDPFAAAELLRGTREAAYVGTASVGGTPVRHYRGTADLAAAARGASQGQRAALRAAAKGFATATVPFDAYLDDQGRIRKVRHRFSFVNDRRQGTVAVASTTLLYGFGTPVDVRLPDSGDIFAGRIAE